MKKSGQITIFIILGVIILISAIAFLALKSSLLSQWSEVEPKAVQEAALSGESIKSYVDSCIISTAKDAIFENGLSGGYFILPEQSTTDLFDNVPYYFKDGTDLSPTDEILAQEIASYVDTMLDLCLDGFEVFEEQGYKVTASNPISEAVFSPEKIIIKTAYPITASLGAATQQMSDFRVELSTTEFYQNILAAREIVTSQEQGELCLSCFSDLAAENELFVNILPTFDNIYVIDITDNNYLITGQNYRLRFAIQYDDTLE
ncbi:MAG TPA: hypothetical protein VJC39_00065 [Candidatus Nanoarchaeia archaeon]|nr:hypothetical protein [Candidatus Nanoarchaeia archaeon]